MVLKVGVAGSIRYVEGQGLSFSFPAIPDLFTLLVAVISKLLRNFLPGGNGIAYTPGDTLNESSSQTNRTDFLEYDWSFFCRS